MMTGGAMSVAGAMTLGEDKGSSGKMTLSDATLSITGNLNIGEAGSGSAIVQLGSVLKSKAIDLGGALGASGSLTISGAGTSVTTGETTIGAGGGWHTQGQQRRAADHERRCDNRFGRARGDRFRLARHRRRVARQRRTRCWRQRGGNALYRRQEDPCHGRRRHDHWRRGRRDGDARLDRRLEFGAAYLEERAGGRAGRQGDVDDQRRRLGERA